MSSQVFFHFPNARMKTNVFREEAIADITERFSCWAKLRRI